MGPGLGKLRSHFFGEFDGVLQSFGHVGEQFVHLFRGFEVKLRHVEFHTFAVGAGNCFFPADADEGVVSFGMLALQVVYIVGGNNRNARALRHAFDRLQDGLLFGDAMAHDFEPEIAFAEQVAVENSAPLGFIWLAREN